MEEDNFFDLFTVLANCDARHWMALSSWRSFLAGVRDRLLGKNLRGKCDATSFVFPPWHQLNNELRIANKLASSPHMLFPAEILSRSMQPLGGLSYFDY
jgi:hypothetical protein